MKRKILMIFQLAIPAMVSSISGIISILFCTRILGQYDNNYYLLAVFMPVNYMIFALCEAIRSASLTLSSACKEDSEVIAINILSLNLVSLLVFGVFLLFFNSLGSSLAQLIGVDPEKISEFCSFSFFMIIAGALNCLFCVYNSTFFALKKPLSGMMVTLFACVLTCSLTYLFSKMIHPSWMGYFIGMFITYLVSIFFALLFLAKNKVLVLSCLVNNWGSLFKKIPFVIKISLPVFMAYLSIFSSLFFINATLNYFDSSVLTGFSVAYRIQNIVILPAITIGTALAILTSRARVSNDFEEEQMLHKVGYGLCFLLYFFISISTYVYGETLMSWVATDKQFVNSGATYLKYVSLTYIAMGPNLTYLTYLEQSGSGAKSFLISVFYFVITVGAGCVSALYFHQYIYLYMVIALINIIFFIFLIPSFIPGYKPHLFKNTTNKDVIYV